MTFLDLLFHRYASPMVIIEKMIQTGRFDEWVNDFVKMCNEEVNDRSLWEVWLHKVFDKTYKDFLDSVNNGSNQGKAPSEAELLETVKESENIINGFCPS